MGLVNSYLDVDSKCIWGCTSILTLFFFKILIKNYALGLCFSGTK